MVKDVVLFMSVGTGGSSDDEKNSLASALAYSIKRSRPEKIFFCVSDMSKGTVEYIKSAYQKEGGTAFPSYEFIDFKKIDSFDSCFMIVSDAIVREIRSGSDVIIDYTSGTKTMTMVMGVAAILHHCQLMLVEGTRNESGKVTPGSEHMSEQALYSVYDKLLFEDVVGMFHAYRFSAALSVLQEKIVSHEYKDVMITLCSGFLNWDQLEYIRAAECFASVDTKLAQVLIPNLGSKISYLQKLNSQSEYVHEATKEEKDKRFTDEAKSKAGERKKKNLAGKYKRILADLICNAHRRIEEGKYEDAVARLYRSVELVAQIKLLQKAGLDDLEGDGLRVDDVLKLLPPERKGEYEDRGRDGKFRFGVRDKFRLLEDLGQEKGWPKGMRVYEGIQGDLEQRNRSVLAHGITPVNRDAAVKMEQKVRDIVSSSLDEDTERMNTLICEAEFPRIEL